LFPKSITEQKHVFVGSLNSLHGLLLMQGKEISLCK